MDSSETAAVASVNRENVRLNFISLTFLCFLDCEWLTA